MLKQNKKVLILGILAIASVLLFALVDINWQTYEYAFSIRIPKIITIILASFCIGSATVIFQTIINNKVITPSLLGINALYILVQTVVVFIFSTGSILTSNKEISFLLNLGIMGVISVGIYSLFFKKIKGNILYILLTGTVLSTLFSSISSTLQRFIDPNEFVALQAKLYASFSKTNTEIIFLAIVILVLLYIFIRKEIRFLDVINLGKPQAINLGVDYDKTIRKLMLVVTLLVSIATALVGPITFLGLIVVNLARQFLNTYKNSYLMVGSISFGIIILLVGQTLVEHVFNFHANIGIIVNLGGGIYFLYLLMKNRE